MNTRTTFFLLLMVGALGAYIYFVDRNHEGTDVRRAKAQKAFDIDPDEVTAIGVENGDFKGRFIRKNGEWHMERPVGALADASAVQRLINQLEKMEKSTVITEAEMQAKGLSMIDYGANNPVARFSIRNGQTEVLYEVGNHSAIGDEIYVWVANGKDVISIPKDFIDALPSKMDDVRDRRLFLAKPEHMNKLELKRPEGFVQMEREAPGSWWLSQPMQTRVNPDAIKYLTGRFHTARIEKFITDEKTDLAIYGFDDDSPYVRIWSELEEFPVKVIVGGPLEDDEKLHYARLEGVDSVFAVSTGMDTILKYEMEMIRERRLLTVPFEGVRAIRIEHEGLVLAMSRNTNQVWQITQPKAWECMEPRVATLYQQWAQSKVARFVDLPLNPVDNSNQGKKLYTITFSENDTIKLAAPGDQNDGERITDFYYEVYEKDYGENKVLVHSVPDNSWCEVVPGMIKYINLDPLYYRDHTVLQIQSNEVLRVSLTMGATTSTVSREAITDAWGMDTEGLELNDVRLDDTLQLCRALVAKSLVELNPVDLTRFDLDKPKVSITFGLTGESGISRTLLLGRTVNNGDVYGMIRGKDLVFTLEQQAVEVLTNNFGVPAVAPGAETNPDNDQAPEKEKAAGVPPAGPGSSGSVDDGASPEKEQ